MEKPNQLVSPEIVSQVLSTRKYLIDHPLFSLSRAHDECRELKRNANRHSVEMEIPLSHKHPNNRDRKEGLHYITQAQKYISKALREDPQITEDMLREAAALIHGYEGKMVYRNVSAYANSYNYQYEDPSEIPNQVFLFLEDNKKFRTNFDKALHAHLHIARIHPFSDGNGRLSRLVSNSLASLDNLPPVQIYPFERKRYCDLINSAQREYRETGKVGCAQREFYNYLAIKIQDSLDRIGVKILAQNGD